jgi:hypothetical protein
MTKKIKQLPANKHSYNAPLQFDVSKGIEPPKIKPEKIFDMMGATKTPHCQGGSRRKKKKKAPPKKKY